MMPGNAFFVLARLC